MSLNQRKILFEAEVLTSGSVTGDAVLFEENAEDFVYRRKVVRVGGSATLSLILEQSFDGDTWYTVSSSAAISSGDVLLTLTAPYLQRLRARLVPSGGGSSFTVDADIYYRRRT